MTKTNAARQHAQDLGIPVIESKPRIDVNELAYANALAAIILTDVEIREACNNFGTKRIEPDVRERMLDYGLAIRDGGDFLLTAMGRLAAAAGRRDELIAERLGLQ